MPPPHNEADFSELCERFANLLPPTVLSADTLLEQRGKTLRSRHARELEAIGRAVRDIAPLFEQLGLHSPLAGTGQGGETARNNSGDPSNRHVNQKAIEVGDSGLSFLFRRKATCV